MKFSVIIPLYNKRDCILRTVCSVLSQSEPDFELLVVDDGSTDGSAELLESEIDDERLLVIRKVNEGGAGGPARNTGMALARGTWFAFLDADDFWLANHLEELAKLIRYVNRPALISTRPLELPDGSPAKPNLSARSTITELDYFVAAGRQIGLNNCSSSAIHREIFEQLGGFLNTRAGNDLEYWARIALNYPVALSDRVTSIYYRGNMGTMEQIAAERKLSPSQDITKLADVSTSLAMLVRMEVHTPDILYCQNIRAYINGRLYAGMRINIRQNNGKQARALRHLMVGSVDMRTQLLTAMARLPKVLLKFLNAGYTIIRRKR